MRKTVLVISLIVMFAKYAFAVVPQTINYQGHLASSGGTPVNTVVDMTFTLYDAATNGTNLWTENQSVQVNNGIYAVALGAIVPIDPAIIDDALWLGVKVGTDEEMTPRQKLHSVPFAMKATRLSEGSNLDSICELYDIIKLKRPDFCPQLNYKKVFLSSQTYDANLGGVVGADQKCQQLAAASGLTGVYKAWISDSTGVSPNTRFTKSSVPYILLNGKYVADNYDDLTDGGIHNNINVYEDGQEVASYPQQVWSHTRESGLAYLNGSSICNNWTKADTNYTIGGVVNEKLYFGHDATGSEWSVSGSPNCNTLNRLYCFEQ